MLSFRDKLNARDPETIRNITASTGFFDDTDIEIGVNLAHAVLNRHFGSKIEINCLIPGKNCSGGLFCIAPQTVLQRT